MWATVAHYTAIGSAALGTITTAIKHFRDPQVCRLLAPNVIQVANTRAADLRLMHELESREDARIAILLTIMRTAPDRWAAHNLTAYGVADEVDIPLLLDEFAATTHENVQRSIGFLLAQVLNRVRYVAPELLESVLAAGASSRVLSEILFPIVGFVVLDSEEARQQRSNHRPSNSSADLESGAEPAPNLDDLLILVDSGQVTVFGQMYYRLAGQN